MPDEREFQYTQSFFPEEPHIQNEMIPELSVGEEVMDMGEDFDFGEFQVVRREFFAHQREPSLTFNNCKIHVNSSALAKFPNATYMQVLISRKTKILALRPCREGDRDAFPWCNIYRGKRKPRPITCKLFYAKVFTMMEWNPDYKYKLLGTVIQAKGEYLLAFDLSSTEVYQRTYDENEKPKISRTPSFPSSWQNQFGLPYYEHRQSMQINIFDGYAIYAIKDHSKQKSSPPEPEQAEMEQLVLPLTVPSGGIKNGWR